MSGTPRIPVTEPTGVRGRLLKAAVRKKIGKVPDSIGVLWNHPRVFTDMMRPHREVGPG